MALQDLSPYDPNAFLDPKTGQPYVYGSPEYQAAVLPMLENQLQREAQRASNARGGFYSGPAMADEQQAAAELASNMAQTGAQQELQNQQMLEQQQFSAQQQAAQNQAALDASRLQGREQQKAAAIQGGLGSLGTIGGLALAHHMGLLGGAGVPATGIAAPAPAAAGIPGVDMTAEGFGATPAIGSGVPGVDMASEGWQGGAIPNSAPALSSGGTATGAAAPSAGFAPGITGIAPATWGLSALAAAPLALQGSEWGGNLYNNHGTNADIGSGIGGGVGFVAGNAALPGVGGVLGAGLGSLVGNQLITHPQNVALAPFTGGLSLVPGIGGWLNNNLNPAHWF